VSIEHECPCLLSAKVIMGITAELKKSEILFGLPLMVPDLV
jgi:hypothetical protein